jgi:hypothetical protein
MNSGERIPCRHRCGVSEQNTKKVLYGIGFHVNLLRGFSIIGLKPGGEKVLNSPGINAGLINKPLKNGL